MWIIISYLCNSLNHYCQNYLIGKVRTIRFH
nr:MAG TPA: hypothetical protein [Caudoviricetes sp.]